MKTIGPAPHSSKLMWARRDTRWDIYPSQEPVELVAFNYEGFWCPQPNGTWYKSPTSFVNCEEVTELTGTWTEITITERCKLWHFFKN